MKKIIFTCLLVSMICLAGYSQKSTFGFKAGVSSNYLQIKNNDFKETGEKTGTYFGFTYQYQAAENFAIQPNLLAAMKGANIGDIKITSWHIDLPINLLYTNSGFFVGAGPNFSYGLDGRAKSEDLDPDGEVDIYSNESDLKFKRFEIGANALMGYTFKNGLSISANFVQGFNDLNDSGDDYKLNSRSFGFAVGYMFGKKK